MDAFGEQWSRKIVEGNANDTRLFFLSRANARDQQITRGRSWQIIARTALCSRAIAPGETTVEVIYFILTCYCGNFIVSLCRACPATIVVLVLSEANSQARYL